MGSTLGSDTLNQNRSAGQSSAISASSRQSSARSKSTANMQSGFRSLQRSQQARKVANGLAWFSVGLAVAELVAPDSVARFVGVKPTSTSRTVLRVAGARELAAGLGILSNDKPEGWVWSRVAGDMLDLSMLASAMNKENTNRTRLNAATLAVLGVTALDIMTGNRLATHHGNGDAAAAARDAGIHVKRSITIGRPRQEVFEFWRDFQNLPRFLKHLQSVTDLGNGRSHWKAKAPAGTEVEWDAEVTADQPHELIAWRSLASSEVNNAGVVRFTDAPGERGTEVHVDLRYDPPGGALGALFAKLFGEEPSIQIADDLRRVKQVMELGEPMMSDATVANGPHPAQPSRVPYRR